MKVETYKKIRSGLAVVVGMGVAWSLMMERVEDRMVVVTLVLGGGMLVMSWLKIQVKDKLEDERIEGVSARAARTAFVVLMPVLGLMAAVLFVFGEGGLYYLRALGIVMSYVTLLGLGLYGVAYWWYDRQTGGRDEE